ncbi:MAG: cupin domain-containing protein [Paracoccaceae bacterium]
MSNLRHATPTAAGEGEASHPGPDRVIEGAPRFTTWPAIEGAISSGIWAATPGQHRVVRDADTVEQFYILEGEIELAEDGGDGPLRFGPGDLVMLAPGFCGTWRTITPVRKLYFTARLQNGQIPNATNQA